MSTPKTTADLFRERGWGVGTKVRRWGKCSLKDPQEVIAIGQVGVFLRAADGEEWTSRSCEGWSIYTPTPPVPTREEWAELWAKLKAFRNLSDARVHQYGHGPVLDLMLAIDAIGAKGGDA